MRQFFPVALVVAGCLIAGQRLLPQAPADSNSAATGQNKPGDESQKPAPASQIRRKSISRRYEHGSRNAIENRPGAS